MFGNELSAFTGLKHLRFWGWNVWDLNVRTWANQIFRSKVFDVALFKIFRFLYSMSQSRVPQIL